MVCIALATSGLDPRSSELLEVAAVAVPRGGGTPYGATFNATVHHPDIERIIVQADPYVFEMHSENGLWETLLSTEGTPRGTVDVELAKWMDQVGASGDPGSPLVGFGAEWIARFMTIHMPLTLARFNRDRVDLSPLFRLNNVERTKNARPRVVADEAAAALAKLMRAL